MPAELRSTIEAKTMVLTISNPEHRNALEPAIFAAGVEALSAAESNPDVRCVVITGEDNTFCAGGNLHRLQTNRQQPPEVQARSIESLHNWIEAIRTCPQPIIAAVEGVAAGAGFSLALACDLIVAARDASFVMTGSRIALSPNGGGSWHLAQTLPRQLASELLLGGERVTADRLHQLGLVNRLSETGQAQSTALAWAEQLATLAPNALTSIKELIDQAGTLHLHQHLQLEREHFARNLRHANAGIGITAFLNKQVPRYE